jgi:translation initiation factor IF-2
MSDTSTSGSTPPEGPAATAGAPSAPAADWGTASGANRGSGLARGKRVSTPAAPAAPVSNTAASGAYQPSAIQVLKADSEYQNPFASADVAPVAPAPAAATPVAPVVAQIPAEAPAPAFVPPAAPAPKAELNILPPAEEKRPAQSWETPAFPYEGNKPSVPANTPAAPSLAGERPLFRPVRRSDVPMLDSAPNASGKSPGIPAPPKYGGQRTQRGNGGGNRQQQHDGRPQQSRGNRRDGGNRNRPAGQAPASPQLPAHSGQPQSADSKKPAGLFGWVKGLFGTAAPEPGKPSQPGAHPQPFAGGGEPRTDGGPRRRRRRGGRGRSGGGGQGNAPGGPVAGPQTPGAPHVQSHGQGHPSHGHGGGNRRRRGGRGRSGGGQGGGHRHEGGGSGIPPSA